MPIEVMITFRDQKLIMFSYYILRFVTFYRYRLLKSQVKESIIYTIANKMKYQNKNTLSLITNKGLTINFANFNIWIVDCNT